jgi:hypothetical protein
VAGCFGEYYVDRVSIVDGEFCCLRPAILSARARQAKGPAQTAAKRSGGQAARPALMYLAESSLRIGCYDLLDDLIQHLAREEPWRY